MKISVIAHPNSKKSRIEKDLLNNYHVYISEPPVDGRANAAIIKSLAFYFNTKKSGIVLLYGEKSKNKLFELIKA